ncbi:Ubiquitin carboxyl-terminal hydrolase [Quillaja saponaria]|uniref:Ubiquitin carboxyl-terminal hydrolase n=1 Tax=Quillaja saponaria TaxID=32244 RepID=A0AAD7KPY4_QUISA|nr:Ubiquitin carboxyl-terminal hydrolase [Quillaja saponaria]
MEIHVGESHQVRSSDSVPLREISGLASFGHVSENSPTGSSLSSRIETLGDHPLVPSLPNEMVSVLSSRREGQLIIPSASNVNGSSINSNPETLGDYPSVPSLSNSTGSSTISHIDSPSKKTLGESLLFSSAETLDDQSLPSLPPQSSTLDGSSSPKPTAAPDDSYYKFCSSDRETPDGDPELASPFRLLGNDLSDYSSSHWSSSWTSQWYSPTSRPFSSSKEWLSWPSSSSGSSWSTFSTRAIVPSMVGAGLQNLGNTCFVNAVLQCFTHTVPLVQGVRSCNHSAPCHCASEAFCVLCALHDHIDVSLATSGGIIQPLKFVENLNYFSSCFRRYQQEDAHEFLQCFLDKLERCFLDSNKKDKNSSSQIDNLVERIFGGRLISKLRCCNCGRCSDTYEPLIDLSLEIENVDTLPSALESFTKVEEIDEKFRCENCEEEVSMEKQLILDQTPSVSAFHLKRFKTDGSYVEKVDKHVEFPLELDLQPYTSQENDVALKYDLYAIVVHIGFSSTSGHYFCFVRSSSDTWHKLDDSKVTRVTEDYVLSQEAYILFYARQANIDKCDASEPREFAEGMPTLNSCGRRHEGHEVNDTVGTSLASNEQFHSGSKKYGLGGFEGSDNDIHTSGNLYDNERTGTVSCLGENNCKQDLDDCREYDGFHPLTPPSSPSPDVYSPEMSYSIPRKHIKLENHESGKRQFNKLPEDSERKCALRYLSSVPSSRGKVFRDALLVSQSEGSINKRRKIMDPSPCKKSRPSSARQKSNHGSVMHPVAAATLR